MSKYLIENWKAAYKMASMWVAGAAFAYSQLPEAQQSALLKLLGATDKDLLGWTAVAFVAARILRQKAVTPVTVPTSTSE